MTTETFSPESHGCMLQRGYTLRPVYLVASDERENGHVASTPIREHPIRYLEGLQYLARTREARDYVDSFLNRHVGEAGRFYFPWPELVPSPDVAPTLEAVVQGAQGARTVTARFAWRNAAGTTLASPTASLAVPENSLVRVLLPIYPAGATHAVIYAADDDAGAEQEQTVLAYTRSWTQPDAPLLLATTSPPAANTATETPMVMLVDGSYRSIRRQGLTWEIQLAVREVHT